MPKPLSSAIFIPLALVAGGIVFALVMTTGRITTPPPPNPATAAPALELPQITALSNAKRFNLTSMRGEKVLVNFFASWCAPCVAELPELRAIGQGELLAIVGVAYNDHEDAIRHFFDNYGNAYARVVLDAGGMVAQQWKVTGIPASFLIDEKGNILARHNGPLTSEVWDAEFAHFFSKKP